MKKSKENSTRPSWNAARISFITVCFASIAFSVIFSIIALHRYWQYEAWYYDFGIFAQAIYNVAHFQPPIIDHYVVTDKLIFADHFHPLIFILAPLFWLTDKPEILLVAQAFAVGLSGIMIFLLAKSILKNNYFATCLSIIYLSFIGLHFAVITEFHEIALLPLPLATFFYAMVNKKVKLYIAMTLIVLLVKESTFIIPAFFCLYQAIIGKGSWRKLNLALMLLSGIYGVLVVKVFIPYFSDGIYQYTNDTSFTLDSLSKMFDSQLKIGTIWKTLASYGFLPLLAPQTLPPVLLNWYTRFSISSFSRHGLGLHYNAEVAPTLLLAATYGIQRLQTWIKKEQVLNILVGGITAWCVFFSVFYLDSPVRLAVIPDFYRHTATFSFLDDLVARVPEEGVVMAQANLAPRFITRKVYMLRDNYEEFNPDWIVVDTRGGQGPNNFFGVSSPEFIFSKLAADPNYTVYYQSGEQIIYQRVQ